MLSTLQTNKQDQNNCGETNWRAASNTLRKKKNLSETGLEIAGCRHSLAQKAVNMMYGEIYGYAHYLQKSYFIPKQVKYFWYMMLFASSGHGFKSTMVNRRKIWNQHYPWCMPRPTHGLVRWVIAETELIFVELLQKYVLWIDNFTFQY